MYISWIAETAWNLVFIIVKNFMVFNYVDFKRGS